MVSLGGAQADEQTGFIGELNRERVGEVDATGGAGDQATAGVGIRHSAPE